MYNYNYNYTVLYNLRSVCRVHARNDRSCKANEYNNKKSVEINGPDLPYRLLPGCKLPILGKYGQLSTGQKRAGQLMVFFQVFQR